MFNHPFFLILNVAVGGNWPGAPSGTTEFPQQMVVDYVRVYAQPGGSPGVDVPPTMDTTTTPAPNGSHNPPVPTTPDPATVPSTAMNNAAITGYGGKCVDVNGAYRDDGTRVQLYTCNTTSAQKWTRSDATLQALGKCLDVSGARTRNGTRVQLWTCNGTVAQDWTYKDGQLVNPHSGRCLDARGPSSATGPRLQIWDCHGGPNQKWQVTSTPSPGQPTPTSTPQHTSAPTMTPPAPPTNTSTAAMGAAPYAYLGWGNPPDPRTIMTATGVKWFTMAFILSNGACDPLWDGNRPLSGGNDQTTINNIRGAGGNVVVSFGGAAGPWLEQTCSSASALAGRVPEGHQRLRAEGDRHRHRGTGLQQPDAAAAHHRRAEDGQGQQPGPGGVRDLPERPDRSGLDDDQPGGAVRADRRRLDHHAVRLRRGRRRTWAACTIQATEGLKNTLKNGYGYSDDQAYRHAGISSMNGITDANETVTQADFRTMLAYAQQHHLARLHVLVGQPRPAVHRRYPDADTCSGVAQQAWDFTPIIAQYAADVHSAPHRIDMRITRSVGQLLANTRRTTSGSSRLAWIMVAVVAIGLIGALGVMVRSGSAVPAPTRGRVRRSPMPNWSLSRRRRRRARC